MGASVRWAWRGALNGFVADVEAWNGSVYALVELDNGSVVVYSLNAGSGELQAKRLITMEPVRYASLAIRNGSVAVILVDGEGYVRLVACNPSTLEPAGSTVFGRVDPSTVDVSGVELVEGEAIVFGGVSGGGGVRPIAIALGPHDGGWSRVLNESGYFIDSTLTPEGLACAATLNSIYCFTPDGRLAVEEDMPHWLHANITGLTSVGGRLAVVGVASNLTSNSTKARSIAVIKSSSALGTYFVYLIGGREYPVSAAAAGDTLAVLAHASTGHGGYEVDLVKARDAAGTAWGLEASAKPELGRGVTLFKVAYRDGSLYLAGTDGAKPFVAALTLRHR
ncbi:hypothetical protein JCM10135_02200 [Stetteria hydrogenophila]